ncbi:hypothetical protein MUK42_09759 [Musa troglodytarum]|uniref:Uncharacterized protein n=1 Tax=Musa troglodytarum TaxID=320322 RepID=A0A9E7EAS1_9LILI|nr:hypothetical protein MUK42_09759 [Musa troglodytarum]
MRSGLSTSLLLILLVSSIGNSESRIVYGEAPSRVTEWRQSTDDDVGRSKLTRNQIVFATRPTEVVADTKRSIPGGPDPQHHCVNP